MLERFFPSRTSKTGLPPGSIIHIGDKTTTKPRIRSIQYSASSFSENDNIALASCPARNEMLPVTWLHFDGLHDTSLVADFGVRYDIHPLALEDLVNTGHRPKIEDLDEYVFIVITAFGYDDESLEVVPNHVNILFNREVVFSFQEGDQYLFSSVNKRIETDKGRMRRKEADYLAYVLLDTIIDNYFEVFDKIGERIEELEEEVIDNEIHSSMNKIHDLKREVAVLKKAIWPLREVVSRLEKADQEIIDESNEKYFRDLYDHVVQLIDVVDVFGDVLNGIRDLYLSMVSNRMNEIMKVLTIIATIFIPLTFVAGVYGMNFKYMPELEWRWGYFTAMGIMFLCAAGMVLYFRKKRWL